MLLLTATTDSLQLITDSAASVDVHATWVDTAGGAITPGRQNTHVAAAATTLVVPSPAASAQRNIKSLHVRNKDPSLSVDITLQVVDSVGALPLYAVTTLAPGQMFQVCDMLGIVVARS